MTLSIIIPTYGRSELVQECLDSILNSTLLPDEIIVIDNNPDGSAAKIINSKYGSKVEVVVTGKNLGASGARDLGAKRAKGEWVLFVDDDNTFKTDCIEELMAAIQKDASIAAVSPIMFYKNTEKLWFNGANFDFLTSRALFFDKKNIRAEFYESQIIHNVFMIKLSVLKKINYFDTELFMVYEEADAFFKMAKLGYKIGIAPKAHDFHNHPENETPIRLINSPARAHSTIRNRLIMMSRYAPKLNYIVFLLTFYQFFALVYIYYILKYKRFDLIYPHILGYFHGWVYVFTKRIIQYT